MDGMILGFMYFRHAGTAIAFREREKTCFVLSEEHDEAKTGIFDFRHGNDKWHGFLQLKVWQISFSFMPAGVTPFPALLQTYDINAYGSSRRAGAITAQD